jgi:hypothetical protein
MQYDVHPNQIRVSKAHLVAAATGLFGSGDAASDASVIAPDRQVANDKAFASCMVEGLSDLFWRRSTARAEQRRLGQGGPPRHQAGRCQVVPRRVPDIGHKPAMLALRGARRALSIAGEAMRA